MTHDQIIGYMGSLLLITCSLPQLIKTLRNKVVDGLSFWMCSMCASGCFMVLYYIANNNKDTLLMLNYLLNGSIYTLLSYLYVRYKKK